MIIIETIKGPVMVNDREVRGFQYDKGNGEVVVIFSNDMPQRMVMQHLCMTSQFEERTLTIKDVENVIYVGDQCKDTYEYQGSEIERLKAIVKKDIEESTNRLVEINRLRKRVSELTEEIERLNPRPRPDTSSGYHPTTSNH